MANSGSVNGDIVVLASYAPLLSRRGHTQWTPDMIYFDATNVFPSLNHTVQKLSGRLAGDASVPTALAGSAGAKLAASAVRNQRGGDLIVKIVNGDDTPQALTIQLASTRKLPAVAEWTVFRGVSADTANTDDAPPAVVPRTDSLPLSPEFSYEAPANSPTILRVADR